MEHPREFDSDGRPVASSTTFKASSALRPRLKPVTSRRRVAVSFLVLRVITPPPFGGFKGCYQTEASTAFSGVPPKKKKDRLRTHLDQLLVWLSLKGRHGRSLCFNQFRRNRESVIRAWRLSTFWSCGWIAATFWLNLLRFSALDPHTGEPHFSQRVVTGPRLPHVSCGLLS